MTLIVDSLNKSIDAVSQIINKQQGDLIRLEEQQPQNKYARHTASIELRVPQNLLSPTLDELAKLGTVESRNITAEDVGDHLVDLQARSFIEPGREVRCGIIVKDGELVSLPPEEYLVDPHERPIRSYTDKFKKPIEGNLGLTAKEYIAGWIVDPNDLIAQKVQQEVKKCHLALGCRHYSLFDFRIDPKGEPWFLEAGLYCTFDHKSVISYTANAAGIPLNELFMTAINEALGII